MKIVLCGSMAFAEQMLIAKEKLLQLSHEPYLNELIETYLNQSNSALNELVKENKVTYDLFKVYFEEIKASNAILVVNEEKKGIKGYIGGNAFLEMGFAYVLNKKIFLLNEIPEIHYKDEIVAMNPIVLNGNLSLIK